MSDHRTLILMRHATAGHQGATRDLDRPLTDLGRREARDAGRWIHTSQPAVDAVLCSTATRTRQTLAATGITAPVSYQDCLYGGGIDDILELLSRLPATTGTVLVIGHAPGIPAAAATLADLATQAARDGAVDGFDPDDPDTGSPADRDNVGSPVGAERDALRRFAAGAVAVLSTNRDWSEILDLGAELVTVRLPGD